MTSVWLTYDAVAGKTVAADMGIAQNERFLLRLESLQVLGDLQLSLIECSREAI